jgi:hypothetical protein
MKVLTVLVLLPLQIFSQDLSGIWTGLLEVNGSRLPFEIAVTNKGDILTGYSLTVFTFDGVENVGIKAIRLKSKGESILIEDQKLIYNNYTTSSRRLKIFGEMLLRIRDTTMILNGPFRTRALDFREQNGDLTYSGIITLRKLNSPRETKLMSTLQELNLANTLVFTKTEKLPIKREKPTRVPPAVTDDRKKPTDTIQAAADLANRETEIIQRVFFKSDSLVIKLYDHGVIDGDTVSVVLNGKVIAANKRLTGKPMQSVIHVTPDLGDSLLLVMYAESLGTIPPNTGVLIVMDGDDRYEIRFEGTKQKSSAILLTRKRKK